MGFMIKQSIHKTEFVDAIPSYKLRSGEYSANYISSQQGKWHFTGPDEVFLD